jgi:hypothetical protein
MFHRANTRSYHLPVAPASHISFLCLHYKYQNREMMKAYVYYARVCVRTRALEY